MEDMLRVGVFANTHGIRGEIKVYPTTDDVRRFKKLKEVILDTGKEQLNLEVQSVKFFKNLVILKFKDFDNINDVEKYKNADITARWYLDEDENYILALYLCYYESTTPDNTDVDEKTKKKMASEVEKIFGVDVSNKDYEYGYDYEK